MRCAIECSSLNDCGAFYYDSSGCHLAKSSGIVKTMQASSSFRTVYMEGAKWLGNQKFSFNYGWNQHSSTTNITTMTETTPCSECDRITIEHNHTGWDNSPLGRSREKELRMSILTMNGREYFYSCPGDESCTGDDLALWIIPNGVFWCIGKYSRM